MFITYGIEAYTLNITSICMNRLLKNQCVIIPSDDNRRARLFSDPLPGILKSIFITDESNNTKSYDDTKPIYIDLITNQIFF